MINRNNIYPVLKSIDEFEKSRFSRVVDKVLNRKPTKYLSREGELTKADAKDYIGRILLLKKALKIDPKSALAYERLGLLCSEMELLTESLSYLKRAREINPALEYIDKNLALAYNDLGVYQQGKSKVLEECYYTEALKLHNKFPDARYNLYSLYLEDAKYEDAKLHLNAFLELEPNCKGAIETLAVINQNLVRDTASPQTTTRSKSISTTTSPSPSYQNTFKEALYTLEAAKNSIDSLILQSSHKPSVAADKSLGDLNLEQGAELYEKADKVRTGCAEADKNFTAAYLGLGDLNLELAIQKEFARALANERGERAATLTPAPTTSHSQKILKEIQKGVQL